MPDVPEIAVEAAVEAVMRSRRLTSEGSRKWAAPIVRAALDGAAPILADEIAKAILRHADKHEPPPGSQLYLTWHRHFGTAARVAAGAFDTREDQVRKMAEAIERGDYVRCDIPEVPDA